MIDRVHYTPVIEPLTDDEERELLGVVARWRVAQWNNDIVSVEALANELMAWGAWPPWHGWHPVFEHPEHRAARVRSRNPAALRN